MGVGLALLLKKSFSNCLPLRLLTENTQISIQSLKRFTWTFEGDRNSLSRNFGHRHKERGRECA